MDKKEIRKEVLGTLQGLTSSQRARWSQQLTERLLSSDTYKCSKSLGTYLSMGHEFDTSYLIEQAQKDGKCIFIPKTYSQGRMDFVEYNPDDLVKTRFGLWEPGTYSQPVDKSVNKPVQTEENYRLTEENWITIDPMIGLSEDDIAAFFNNN